MKTNGVLALIGAFLIAVLAGSGFWLKKEIDATRAAIVAMGRQVEAQPATTKAALREIEELIAARDSDPLFGEAVELRTAADIEQRTNQLGPNASIEETAAVLGEVDQWFFSEAEEAAVHGKLAELTDKLRDLIEGKIELLLVDAVGAETGNEAAAIISQANDLLALYPASMTTANKENLSELAQSILKASQRVEEIRRLRYNAWAINQIGDGLAAYERVKGRVFNDDVRLVNVCHQHLKEIDPLYLEPVALDLYNHVIGLTAKKVNDDSRVRLAQGFADPGTVRKTPLDF